MKLRDLICDKSDRISTYKLWYNIGHVALVYAFIWEVMHRGLNDNTMLVFGSLVCGSRLASRLISARYQGQKNDSPGL